jgi:MinD-like ATPase involved in chromosome partitioning or flagellar assembly
MPISGSHASEVHRAGAGVIPFGGGKGGVGKTFLVANLATALARQGHRVVAVDGDLEGANLHTCLGVPRPRASLADYVAHREEDLQKLLLETHLPNLALIAATRSHLGSAQPSHSRRVQLLRALRALPADFVLLDLGAGLHPAVMDYFMVGENGVVVISPEPTSVENAYAFIRAAFYRRLRLAMVSHDVRRLVTLAMDERNERSIRTPIDLLRASLDPKGREMLGHRILEYDWSFIAGVMGYANAHSAEVQFRKKIDKALERIHAHHSLKRKRLQDWKSNE